MELKYAVDFSNKNTAEAIIAGVCLGIMGLVTAVGLAGIGWLQELSTLRLTLYILMAIIVGTYLHEAYHWLTAKLLGDKEPMKLLPIPSFVPQAGFTKWAAIGIKLAPGTDLTLIACIVIKFFPGPLNPLLMIFLAGNLAGSGNDFIQTYYILKLAAPGDIVRLTPGGFEVWG